MQEKTLVHGFSEMLAESSLREALTRIFLGFRSDGEAIFSLVFGYWLKGSPLISL
jgi:hypothetical protein